MCLKDTLVEISNNVMFRLSLCSRELFHSNFWAWLIEKQPIQVLPIFVKDLDLSKIDLSNFDVKREETVSKVMQKNIYTGKEINKKCNADISFKLGDTLYIIENKFKSLPDSAQLNNYIEGKSSTKIILASFIKPYFELKPNMSFVSYETILFGLQNVDLTVFKEDEKSIIKNYIECLRLLVELKKELSFTKNSTLTYGEFIKQMESVKEIAEKNNFYYFIEKIFYSNLLGDILSDLNNKDVYGGVYFVNKAKYPYMDVMLSLHHRDYDNISKFRNDISNNTNYKIFTLGVQITNNEYRKYFNIIKKKPQKNDDLKQEITKDVLNNYKDFIGEKEECRSKVNNGFWCYDSENDMWFFSKTKIDITRMNFEQLKKQIKKDIDYLIKNKKNFL